MPDDPHDSLRFEALDLEAGCCRAGPFTLLGAWQLHSRNGMFGGYSALLELQPGKLTAFSDRGYFASFTEPTERVSARFDARFGSTQPDTARLKASRDIESATFDPATGSFWLAQEQRNVVTRYDQGVTPQAFRQIPEWRDWTRNTGAEAMVRLPDGRFLALCECNLDASGDGHHPAVLFAADPTEDRTATELTYAGTPGFRPTDMAQLPDGRVLILERRLLWPIPARFAMRIVLADPAEIRPGQVWQGRELVKLEAPWPVDNYEGLAIGRDGQGRLIAWIISDENEAVSQRALLLKLQIDEAALPAKQKAPGPAGRP